VDQPELEALLIELVRELRAISLELRKITLSREVSDLRAQLRGAKLLIKQFRNEDDEE
jgi:hypothetical protein